MNTGAATCETDDIGGGGGGGTVTSVSAGTGLSASPNPITGSGTILLNLGSSNTWTATQSFSGGATFPGSGIWNTSGNVGIGTASPGAKIEVRSLDDILTTKIISARSNNLTAVASLTWNGLDVSNTIPGNAANVFRVNGTEYMRIMPDGNVGIGTASPGAKLDVRGGLTGIYVDTDANGIYTTSNNNGVYATNNFNGVYATGNTFDFYGTGNSNFGGNVGIGTMGSRSRLDVAGGDISIDNGRTFYSRGRMHIHGEENLYLLNKGGVIVSKAWGGNGNLTVEGSISAGENLTMGSGRVLYSSGRMHIHGEENLYLLNKGGVIVSKAWGGNGNLTVEGNLSVTGVKNFEIDHPTNPGYKLVHSTLEGPEAAVFYRSAATLVNGQSIVELPEYFEALTRKAGRTVQLTSFGGYSPLYVEGEVKEGKFVVKTTSDGNPNQQFYWEVKAVRADVEPLRVEKPSGQ